LAAVVLAAGGWLVGGGMRQINDAER